MASQTRFEDEVEGSLRGLAKPTEAGSFEDVVELARAGLSAKDMRPVLGYRMRAAERSRRGVVEPSDGIDIVLYTIAGERLDQHNRAVLR